MDVKPDELKKSLNELSSEERDKFNYLSDLVNANIKDKALIDNLNYMMETGFTNF